MRSVLTTLAFGACLTAAGCGFTPMYASGGAVAPALSSIDVEAPRTRVGHLLREELDDALARDRSRPAAYRLAIQIEEDRYARGLRVDDVATRYEVALRVDYILTETRARRQVRAGTVSANVTYDSADQPYAGVAAFQDGQERAATQAAERLRLDLARWFALSRRAPTDPVQPGVPDATPATGAPAAP